MGGGVLLVVLRTWDDTKMVPVGPVPGVNEVACLESGPGEQRWWLG